MNRSHRLSSGAKKVTPPSIPNFTNPRGSGSSFGSDLSYSHEDHHSNHMSTFSRAPNGESSSSSTTPGKQQATFNITEKILVHDKLKCFPLFLQANFFFFCFILLHTTLLSCWKVNSRQKSAKRIMILFGHSLEFLAL